MLVNENQQPGPWKIQSIVLKFLQQLQMSPYRSSHQRYSIGKGVLKNFVIFTGIDPCPRITPGLFPTFFRDLLVSLDILFHVTSFLKMLPTRVMGPISFSWEKCGTKYWTFYRKSRCWLSHEEAKNNLHWNIFWK